MSERSTGDREQADANSNEKMSIEFRSLTQN